MCSGGVMTLGVVERYLILMVVRASQRRKCHLGGICRYESLLGN